MSLSKSFLAPRLISEKFAHAQRVMPVVAITGARQTGKSTLVKRLSPEGALYESLENLTVIADAKGDPESFVARHERMIIDEVQRVPELLMAIKKAVDSDTPRRPGRFILTGSANFLMMKQINESLAGRAVYLTMNALTRREQLGLGAAGIWQELLDTPVKEWRDLVLDQVVPAEEWRDLATRGGYPTPSLEMQNDDDRSLWFEGYFNTYLQRDIPEFADIGDIVSFSKLLRLTTANIGTMINLSQLAGFVGMSQTTATRYANIMEASYQLLRIPAFSTNTRKAIVKSPKWYWGDTGMAWWLGGRGEPKGEHLENIVCNDLIAWKSSRTPEPTISFWRTSKGAEVDFVIQDEHVLLPIEVKTTRQPGTKDMGGMRTFMEDHGDKAKGGILLHDGEQTFWIAKNVLATPWWRVV